jgi:hypothetical protein
LPFSVTRSSVVIVCATKGWLIEATPFL